MPAAGPLKMGLGPVAGAAGDALVGSFDAWGNGSVMEVSPGDVFGTDFFSGCLDGPEESFAASGSADAVPALNATSGSESLVDATAESRLPQPEREPCAAELLEYMDRFQLQAFFTGAAKFVARHLPPDPFEFLLGNIEALVAEHRATCSSAEGVALSFEAPARAAPAQVTDEHREVVVKNVMSVIRSDGLAKAAAAKLVDEFCGGADLSEEGFAKLVGHLAEKWRLQEEDGVLMANDLKRWRFRSNAARGTSGHPLWPISREDFMQAYPGLLRSVRDRYVPMGGLLHRSIFVRKAAGGLAEKYALGPKLGQGAFGEVFLVTLRKSKAKRVCKRMDRRYQNVSAEELANEVDLLRALDHPHVIRVFEFFEDDDYLEMIMEPVLGGTLTKLLQGVYPADAPQTLHLTEGWIAAVLGQLLSALAYAHSIAGLIHKDLKTDNVLMAGPSDLCTEEQLKQPVHAMLADFGIAEVFSASASSTATDGSTDGSTSSLSTRGRSTRVGGTPPYMSPEMFKGSFTEKSDMWSLGVITFQMLTGELPFKGRNLYLLGTNIISPRKHPPWQLFAKHSWSLGARMLCQQMLMKDEAMRPSAAEASRDAWLAKAAAASARSMAPASEADKIVLHQPHLQSYLMKVARACIASQLNLSQLHQMNLRFKLYDVSGDGRLSYTEMRHVMKDLGFADSEDVDHIIESLDSDRSGLIEYSEFIAGCLDLSSESMRQELHVAFSVFDLDDSGTISLEELRHVLTEGPNSASNSTTPHAHARCVGRTASTAHLAVTSLLPDGMTVEELMKELDTDCGGSITFDEFEKHILAEHEKIAIRREEEGPPPCQREGCADQSAPGASDGVWERCHVKQHGRRFCYIVPSETPRSAHGPELRKCICYIALPPKG